MKTDSHQGWSQGPSRSGWRSALVAAVGVVALTIPATAVAQLRVMVSIEPYREAAERLVGPDGTVDVLLPPGATPHAFDPSPRDVVRLSGADLFVVNGGVDAWALDLAESLDDSPPLFRALDALGPGGILEGADDHTDDRGDANPHVWLDPQRMRTIVAALTDRVAALDPDRADLVRAAGAAYDAELAQLDADMAATLAPVAGAPFVPFHDAWPYFAERFRLDLVLEIEPFPGREPSARALAEAVTMLRAVGARAIFTESQLDDRAARVLAAEAGVQLGVLDPLGGSPRRDGYLALQRYNAATVATALGDADGDR